MAGEDTPENLPPGRMPTTRGGVIRSSDLEPLAAFLDRVPRPGIVPLCWHWCQLLDPVDPRLLDGDGFLIGGMATPDRGMTRMFAGGRVHTLRPLRLDVETTRTTRLSSVISKKGRHGEFQLVTLTSTWVQEDQKALVDEQDYVFTTAPSPSRPSVTDTPLTTQPTEPGGQLRPGQIDVSEPMLVAFSGLTANPYRLHWDRDFCTREGHPGLVIHGPLQALWLADEFTRRDVDGVGRTFSYRLTAPATAPSVMTVDQTRDGGMEVRRSDGTVTAIATLI